MSNSFGVEHLEKAKDRKTGMISLMSSLEELF